MHYFCILALLYIPVRHILVNCVLIVPCLCFELYLQMAEVAAVGVTVRDVAPAAFISAYAEILKNNDKFRVPKWTDTVKTGVSKELAPYNPDWYFIRAGTLTPYMQPSIHYMSAFAYCVLLISAAAVARKIYLRQGTGVGALKTRFGTNYHR